MREELHHAHREVDRVASKRLKLLRHYGPFPRKLPEALQAPRRPHANPLREEGVQHERLGVSPVVAPSPGGERALQLLDVLPLVLEDEERRRAERVRGGEPRRHGDGVAGAPEEAAEVQEPTDPQVARQRDGHAAEGRDLRVLGGARQAPDGRELRHGGLEERHGRRLHDLVEQRLGRADVHAHLGRQPDLVPARLQRRAELLRLEVELGEGGAEHLRGVEQGHLHLEEAPRDEAHGAPGHGPARAARALPAGALRAPGRDEAAHEPPSVVLDGPPEGQVHNGTD
mmetsp:Transcript_59209/g.185811  ORF Transcript_59209/g.185811 Transcript_59209/m.185811 type:complete len:285 (-) Transcript_59209:1702-2556(-)